MTQAWCIVTSSNSFTSILPSTVDFASNYVRLLQCSHHRSLTGSKAMFCCCITSWQSTSHYPKILCQEQSLCPRAASLVGGVEATFLDWGKYHREEYPMPAVSCHLLCVTAVFHVITYHNFCSCRTKKQKLMVKYITPVAFILQMKNHSCG